MGNRELEMGNGKVIIDWINVKRSGVCGNLFCNQQFESLFFPVKL